ncbi:unnamed protein product [Rangifer tarandus platyrhynchus]|uniref:Uncharacterized protein n=2 Tax=Rangifer tarandus platyrhynchus TaxID=3082113 RepID=A0ABN8ZTK9_RANTA|nr:unnamed protein product [Rangifer tarandus platyrhynchus]CAI9709327.1 unnamed protein product [Rangifer tarandus platyrhynchus]
MFGRASLVGSAKEGYPWLPPKQLLAAAQRANSWRVSGHSHETHEKLTVQHPPPPCGTSPAKFTSPARFKRASRARGAPYHPR